MKYNLFLFLFFIVLFITAAIYTVSIHAQGTQPSFLGQGEEKVTQTLGKPLQQTSREGMTIYWYSSTASLYVDLYYAKNSTIIFESFAASDKTQTLKTYIDQYGMPPVAVARSVNDDSYRSRIYAWPEKGIDIIASGEELKSPVMRVERFAPITKDDYFISWGNEYKTNPQVTLHFPSSLSTKESQHSSSANIESVAPILIGTVGIILCGISIVFVKKRKKPQKQAESQPLE